MSTYCPGLPCGIFVLSCVEWLQPQLGEGDTFAAHAAEFFAASEILQDKIMI